MVAQVLPAPTVRPAEREDSARLASDWYAAFSGATDAHGFPRDFQSIDHASEVVDMLLDIPSVYSFVAEFDREPVGGAFLWQGEEVAGIGPVFVRPDVQGGNVGRHLMEAVIRQSDRLKHRSTRLTQSSYNGASMALYAKLGFEVKEPLVAMQGERLNIKLPGYTVRQAYMDDLDAMDRLCQQVHGHRRTAEIAMGIGQETARVCEVLDTVVGYTTQTSFMGHTVGMSNEAIYAILGAAEKLSGVKIPVRNAELFRWCLDQGMKITGPSTLMVRGWYQEPKGAFLPSVLF